jgi:hypothetical protein
MNQKISKQKGKHRHVSKNTVTLTRMKEDRRFVKKAIIPQRQSVEVSTKRKIGFFGKLYNKLFKKGG